MRTADVYVSGARAGVLEELVQGHSYRFIYDDNYTGQPVSLTMPLSARSFEFDSFPPDGQKIRP